MNTLDELVYYCREEILAGALLLNGDWGCGKSHLIEHELKQALTDTHLVARISLFGIADTASLNRAVRRGWLAAIVPALEKLEKHEDALKRSKEIVDHSLQIAGYFQPFLKQFKGASSSSDDILAFLPIQNKIKTLKGEREFVLVFDDLERTKLSIVDTMGCINEFCENQRFKTIIVANEEKIINRPPENMSRFMMGRPNESGFNAQMINTPYLETKEKMICRTVRCVPEYRRIFHSILLETMAYNKEYQEFLLDNEELIESIFEAEPCADVGQPQNRLPRSYNIRTLRSALIDFGRVYRCLKSKGIEDISIYLCNFIVLHLTVNTSDSYIKNRSDEEIDQMVAQNFPAYDARYLLQSERKWILDGVWDETRFEREGSLLNGDEDCKTPEDQLRRNAVTDLEEDVILKGFEPLLQDVYAGELTLDEYVTFIKNVSELRCCDIETPCRTDWDQVMKGIEIRFQRDIESNNVGRRAFQTISDKQKESLSAEELAAYDRIETFRQQDRALFESSRRTYLRELKENGIRAFENCEKLRFNCFDGEMASATADCYAATNQLEKHYFPIYFKEYWKRLSSDPNTDSEKTTTGLTALKKRLEELCETYQAQKRGISAKHTGDFVQVVDELIDSLRW